MCHIASLPRIAPVWILCALVILGGHALLQANPTSMPDQEQTLATLIEQVATATDTVDKLERNRIFQHQLEQVLAQPQAFGYAFDRLPYTYKVRSDDGLVCLLTWLVPIGQGYHYFGYVLLKQHKRDKEHRLVTLHDYRNDTCNAQTQVTPSSHWYGSVYTGLVTKYDKKTKQTYYTLLGLTLSDPSISKKIIEVMLVRKDSVVFGAPIFDMDNGQPWYRVIMEYQAGTSLPLLYDPKQDMILYTPAVPMYRQLQDRHEMYVADEAYQGLTFKGGKWEKVEERKIKSNVKSKATQRPPQAPRNLRQGDL